MIHPDLKAEFHAFTILYPLNINITVIQSVLYTESSRKFQRKASFSWWCIYFYNGLAVQNDCLGLRKSCSARDVAVNPGVEVDMEPAICWIPLFEMVKQDMKVGILIE